MKIKNVVMFGGLSLVIGLFFGCSKKEAPRAEPQQTAAATPSAMPPLLDPKQVFATRCVVCHGKEGKGDGPGAAALQPKPRDYSDAAWQKTVTDEDLKKVIVLGGPAVGKSPIMPGNPDLESQPQVVEGLVAIIRSYAKP